MMNKRHKNSGFLLFAASAFLAVSVFPFPATAQCIDGIPCITPKEPNDPEDLEDGPNVDGDNASKTDSAACDADFMNQIYAKAFIEAEREKVLAEVLVRKPDSVLEYTCFGQLASLPAHYAGPLFSESDAWQNIQILIDGNLGGSYIGNVNFNVYMGPNKLDNSIQQLVLTSLDSYIDSNFAHDYLGGSAVGENNDISAGIQPPGYTCAMMESIYEIAKCRNFGEDDMFFTFDFLAGNDPRALPPGAECGGTAITANLIDLAKNADYDYVNFDPVVPTYLSYMIPGVCEDPIETGLIVSHATFDVNAQGIVNPSPTSHIDKICPNPGCFYDGLTCAPTP